MIQGSRGQGCPVFVGMLPTHRSINACGPLVADDFFRRWDYPSMWADFAVFEMTPQPEHRNRPDLKVLFHAPLLGPSHMLWWFVQHARSEAAEIPSGMCEPAMCDLEEATKATWELYPRSPRVSCCNWLICACPHSDRECSRCSWSPREIQSCMDRRGPWQSAWMQPMTCI